MTNLISELRSIGKIKDLGKEFPRGSVTKEVIYEDSNDQRIDNFLIKRLKGVPRSHIYQNLRSGQVRINGKRVKASYRLQEGDIVRIPPVINRKNKSTNNLSGSKLTSFDILFQDASLLAINKPAGIAVHGGSSVSFGVIEQLRAQNLNWKFLELVHRLDRDTSGILLLAKKRSVLVDIHQQIRERTVEKRYLVLVKGKWQNKKQNVKLSLNKYVSTSGERRVAVTLDKKRNIRDMTAHTVFNLRKTWKNFSLLEAELKTGRTHQIRVHLAYLGFPIVGDEKYGDFSLNNELKKTGINNRLKLKRMFLHATKIIVTHPATGKSLSLKAPLSDELKNFLNELDKGQDTP